MGEERGVKAEVEAFIDRWRQDKTTMSECFRTLYAALADMEGVVLRFIARPGVSYSLRPWHANGAGRDFFAIVDVIDDDPGERWLSVCFYRDMIRDPQELGESIPGGLGGSDGYCFNLFTGDRDMVAYLRDRLEEAAAAAR